MIRLPTLLLVVALPLSGCVASSGGSSSDGPRGTQSGTVERVWEDGFSLNTGSRTIRVDSWDVFGDNTRRHVAVGDRVQVTGEFSGGEFDAATVTGGSGGAR
jgi:hypothetical protein